MERYIPQEDETLRCSNLMFGMMSWFYNKGHYKTCKLDEGKQIDQRVFGPAVARGLLANDGVIWYITETGVQWVKNFLGRDAWKENPSRQFSHYIKVQRARLQVVHHNPEKEHRRARAAAV